MSNTLNQKVVINAPQEDAGVSVSAQLLGVLGHQVLWAKDIPESIRLASQHKVGLIVISSSDTSEQRAALEQLATLPANIRPSHVAFLSTDGSNDAIPLRNIISGSKVHLYVKPIHVHGLLGIIKKMSQPETAHVN